MSGGRLTFALNSIGFYIVSGAGVVIHNNAVAWIMFGAAGLLAIAAGTARHVP